MRKALAAAIVLTFCLNVAFVFLQPRTPIFVGTQSSFVPIFVSVPKFRSLEDSIYGDILSHVHRRLHGDSGSRSMKAHETAHSIHFYLRKYTQRGKKVSGFYCLKGRGVIIEEPNIRKSQVNKFVPQNLRSYRYNLYLVGQWALDDTPLYIYDEWVAYVLGGMVSVEDIQKDRHQEGWTDGVSGCLEFSIYAVSLCMAVKEHDPQYWESNTQFRNFTIWMLHKSQETYKIGYRMKELQCKDQDDLLKELLISSPAAPMREFIREHLGGAWLDMEVLHKE